MIQPTAEAGSAEVDPSVGSNSNQALIRLAVGAKQLEATSGTPEIASSLGYKVSAVIRTRVAELLKRW